MKIKELIKELENLNQNASIYLQDTLEIYEPVVQELYDTEDEKEYYIIVKE